MKILKKDKNISRTILEFKYQVTEMCSNATTAILVEPYWNLNRFLVIYQCKRRTYISRTILEFKLMEQTLNIQTLRILVEPYWNLNDIKTNIINIPGTRLVEPSWNLNSYKLNSTYPSKLILVEPYWNLNNVNKIDYLKDGIDISRTILEFKFDCRCSRSISIMLY